MAADALRSYGQVVPGSSSAAAAFTEPSRSARAEARSASARSVRNRLGCQPTRCSGVGRPQWGEGGGEGVAVDAELAGGLPQPDLAGELVGLWLRPSGEHLGGDQPLTSATSRIDASQRVA
jgi:hypothetical protein